MSPQTTTARSVPAETLQLLQILADCAYSEKQLCTTLKILSTEHPPLLNEYPEVPGSYSRTILYRDPSGFEAIAARWSKNAITPIHGHPQFAFLYLISGALSMDLYAHNDSLLTKTGSRILKPGEYFYSKGTAGTYDNAIHQVSADLDSLSFHIYSDNALKGEIYS